MNISKNFLAVMLILLTAIAAFGQERWENFYSEADDFSVDIPFPLTDRSHNTGWRKFVGSLNGEYLYVFSDKGRDTYQIKTVTEFLKSYGQRLSIYDNLASPVHFRDDWGYWHTVVAVKTGERTLLAQGVSKAERSPVVERFISTFRIGKGVPPTADRGSAKVVVEPTAAEMSRGIGNGTSTAPGVGYSTPSITPTPVKGVTHGIKILTKPKPAYTDLARFYEISGTVILRVAFKENGSIGYVQTVKELPFGLTESAISAAQAVQFDHAMVNGTPVSVTKAIEYSFSIY